MMEKNMIFLIGSRALPDNILERDIKNSDIDLIMSDSNYQDFISQFKTVNLKESSKYPGKYLGIVSNGNKFEQLEIDATDNQSNHILRKMYVRNYKKYFTIQNISICGINFEVAVPKLEISYLIKKSHIKCPVNFDKNYSDYVQISKKINKSNVELFLQDEYVKEFYIERYNEAKERFENKQKKINFNVPNEKFFKKSEGFRIFDHDNLHVAIARNGVPVYTKCKRDPNKALIDNDMYFDLSFEDQASMIMEEATVIGIERFFLDTDDLEVIKNRIKNMDATDAESIYKKGLYKFVRDLCKGDFQDHVLTIEMTNYINSNYIPWHLYLHDAIHNLTKQGELV